MNVFPIVDRLKERLQNADHLMEIGAAAELDAAMRSHAQPPAIYVVPSRELNVSANQGGACSAGTAQTVSVITVVDELGDPAGAEALRGLPAIRRQIRAALSGWTPDERLADPIAFIQGELIQFEGDGLLWWADEYAFVSYGEF